MANVIPFRKKEEEKDIIINKINDIKENFLKTLGVSESELFELDEIREKLKKLKENGNTLVFSNEEEAMIYSVFLLNLPENENISHYEIKRNISRKSLFFTLEPIYKQEGISYVFPSNELTASVNSINLDKEIERNINK
jgi:hypothetical protein